MQNKRFHTAMPTIRRCCIVGCLSNSRQSPNLQFFQFPKPENPFNKLWRQACHASLSRILPFKKPVVCAMHFHPTCIGGRRLTSSAVPSLRLEVPSNLKAVEQQAMVEEIERSRKCAYINAVVYEWLVRANLNPQLRGSITHGMIKEKADTAKQLIGSTTFTADNRWLNRFRETHLNGFAQKLATNQLKPLGPSLWIPDIVQDLQHLFPPTSADRVAKLENVPEQYHDYMQDQYGEYEGDDDSNDQSQQSQQEQSYQSQQDQSYQSQQEQSYHSQDQSYNQSYSNSSAGFDPFMLQPHQPPNYTYDDYNNYYDRQQQHHQQQQLVQAQTHYPSPQPTPTHQQHSRPPSHSPPQSNRVSPYQQHIKRQKLQEDHDVEIIPNGGVNDPEQIEDLTDGPEIVNTALISVKNNLKAKINGGGSSTPSNGHSSSASPTHTNGQSNGHASPAPTPNSNISPKELETYAQALEYLKPLEDFALFKENFRAIGLISQLEVLLRKGERTAKVELD